MTSRHTATCLLFMAYAIASHGQVIPDSIRTDWSGAGASGFNVDTSNVADVTAFGAAGNGITNDLPAVVAAMTSLNGNGVVYFPAGNYLMNGPVYMGDSMMLKGASAAASRLVFDLGGMTSNCINIVKGQTAPYYPLAGGLEKDSRKLVSDSAYLFSAGDHIELRQLNGSWDTNPAAWAQYSVGHMARVDSVAGDSVYIDTPLRMNLNVALQPEIRQITPRFASGLECLSISRTDSTAPGVNYAVYCQYAVHCRIRGIESVSSIGAHVWAETSSHLEITGSYFHHAYNYDGASTHGYGVVMAAHTGDSRIENNIFRFLRHAMMVKQGASGNVFAYNYSIDPFRSEFPNDFGADISLHGHFPFANLFEGNICQNLVIDQAWGPSGPFNTFFRNRVERYGVICLGGSVDSDRQNFVGNDITGTGLGQGQYALSGTDHLEYGNNDNGVIVPPGTQVLDDTSYYLDAVPAFWNIASPFPNIGTPNPVGGQTIPARERYLAGTGLTICNDLPSAAAGHANIGLWSFGIVPVTGNGVVVVCSGLAGKHLRLEVTDSRGRLLKAGARHPGTDQESFFLDTSGWTGGLYFITVFSGGRRLVKKFVVN